MDSSGWQQRFHGRLLSAALLCFLISLPAQGRAIGPESTRGQFIESIDKDLESRISELNGKEKNPLIFSANLVFAHGAFIADFPAEILIKYVDALKGGGVSRIEINPSIEPWRDSDLPTIRKYDAIAEHIQRSGLQLVINPEYTRKTDQTVDFHSWSTSALRVYAEIARRYRPYIFVAVHEPSIMAARMMQKVSPEQWSGFVRAAIRIVKTSSPSTRCGVGVLFNEREYLNRFLSIKGLDTVSVDIYSLAHMEAYDAIIKTAKRKGKSVYVEETWRPAYARADSTPGEKIATSASQGVGDYDFMKTDMKWLEMISLYASARRLEAITPFWTQTFFLYVKDENNDGRGSGYNDRVVEAIQKGRRTETFRTYKRLSETFGPHRLVP